MTDGAGRATGVGSATGVGATDDDAGAGTAATGGGR